MRKLTKTQESIMAVITDGFASPTEIGERAGIDNSGGTAASLRKLVERGLVEQRLIGNKGRWELFGYRLVVAWGVLSLVLLSSCSSPAPGPIKGIGRILQVESVPTAFTDARRSRVRTEYMSVVVLGDATLPLGREAWLSTGDGEAYLSWQGQDRNEKSYVVAHGY